MEQHQTSEDESFLRDELEDILHEPPIDTELRVAKKPKRTCWMVRVRSKSFNVHAFY